MKSFFSLLLLSLLSQMLLAQTRAVTENGRRVLLLPDGSWKYEFNEPVRDYSCDELMDASNKKSAAPLLIDDGKGGYPISLSLSSKTRITTFTLTVQADQEVCIRGTHGLVVMLLDGKTLSASHAGADNCEGEMTLEFYGTLRDADKKALEALQATEIASIRLTTSQGTIRHTVSRENSKKLKTMLGCL